MTLIKSVCLWLLVCVCIHCALSDSGNENGIIRRLKKQLCNQSEQQKSDRLSNQTNSSGCRASWRNHQLKEAYMRHLAHHFEEAWYVGYDESKIESLRGQSRLLESSTNHVTEGPTSKYSTLRYPSTCPFHLKDVKRDDRYPFTIKHAVCDCLACKGTNDTLLSCQTIQVAKPVMKRVACASDKPSILDHHRWFYTYELVPIACSCKSNIDLQPKE